MFKNYFRLTKTIVIFSIIASFASYYTLAKGWGEVYPFYTYKLFSQPLGTKNTFSEYRIYSKSSPDENFKRNKITPTKGFDTEDYVSTLNYLTNETLKDTLNDSDSKLKLLTFIKHVAPGQLEYKVVSITYHPILLLKTNSYDTATVVSF